MNSTATKEYETVSLPVIYLPPDFDAIFPRTKSVLNVARKMGVAATHTALRSKRHILLLHQKVELDEREEATPERSSTYTIRPKFEKK